MGRALFRSGAIMALLAISSACALEGTKGVPLGGMGTGYIVYDAVTGQFASSGKVMPPAQFMTSEFSGFKPSSSGFYFFANGASKAKAATAAEDAKLPVYTANFGATGGVAFSLTAFGPIVPGAAHEQLVQSPLAFFDIKAVNNNTAACTAAVAMEFANGTLLGGVATGVNDGNNAITWAGAAENAYMIANCTAANPVYTAGSQGAFLTNGSLTTGAGNFVAAKCYVAAGATANFRFVLSWYQQWTGPKGDEGHWYHNFYTNAASGSKDCAVYGMNRFDLAENGATSIVNRVMASNFPAWYNERLLNNLYPVVHNMQCAKDGRVAMWEGQYPILGTLDQTQHGATFFCFNWPQSQWRELQYWARQQHKETALLGQVHHDFNGCASGNWDAASHMLNAWDDYTHNDYWFQPNTTDWGDLNCMFIYKAYELMLATGNRDSLNRYWPNIKLAVNRTFNQCKSGAHLANETIKSSYDSDGEAFPDYVVGLQLTAWLAAVEMAKFLNDDSSATRIKAWYDAGRSEFRARFFNGSWATGDSKCEMDAAGVAWQRYFNLPAIVDSDIVATGQNRLWSYYSSLSSEKFKLGNWHFYTYEHFGGLAISCGKADNAMSMHQWDYTLFYTQGPAFVFWQDLWNANNAYQSYCTAPVVWHSLFDMEGYLLDNANNRLWVRPVIPTSMNKTIANAPLINPQGWGTLDFDENYVASTQQYQNISVKFDSLVTIKEIVLKNNTGLATFAENTIVMVNNGAYLRGFTAAAEGAGFEKNIRITLAASIQVGLQGLSIRVYGTPASVKGNAPIFRRAVSALMDNTPRIGSPVRYSVDVAGHVTLAVIGLNGVKIATIVNSTQSAGVHTAVWNGASIHGAVATSGIAIARLTTETGTVSQKVFLSK